MRHSTVGWRSRTVSTAAAVLVWSLGGAAWAAPELRSVTLVWDAPEGCPTADEVLDEVDRTLVEPGGTLIPVTATVRVSAGPGEVWQASLTLDFRGARTERRFRAESCGAIAAATAVIIAIAVEDASEAPLNQTGASSTQDGDKPPPPITAPPAAAERASQLFVMVNGLVDRDTMPSPPAVGFEVAVGRRWGADRWRLRLVAGADFFPSQPPADVPYIGAVNGTFWLVGVSGRGCLGVAMSRLEIGPCLGAELVAMHASDAGNLNSGLTSLANQTLYWVSLLGSIAASWNVSPPMDVVLRADLVVPTKQRVFGLEGNVLNAYQVPARAFRGALGIEVRFP
jgi:hypothetical protein